MKKQHILTLAILLFVGTTLRAQVANPTSVITTQQTATHADAAINVATTASSATTLTITPPAGQYVYVMGMDVQNCGDATGVSAAATTTITTTGFGTSAPTWLMGSGSTAGACVPFTPPNFGPGGLRSATAGAAVTFVTPTFATHQTIRINVYYEFGY